MKMQKSAETFLRNKDSELMDDMMELIDQFATGNVDLKFYQRIQRAYSRSVKER
jgi:hypothetical protein